MDLLISGVLRTRAHSMAKLTKKQAKLHAEACKLLEKQSLTFDEKWFVLENWQEGANHLNSVAGAFFTPALLARDLAMEVCGPRLIDLCAGIGALAFAAMHGFYHPQGLPRITCLEINPDYIEVGKKILPEAHWVRADVFRLPPDLGKYDCAIANPPFGTTPTQGASPRYAGPAFEYKVIDIASDRADYGVFLIPQTSAPFEYSGKQCYSARPNAKYDRFREQTDVELGPSCGIDTSIYQHAWNGVMPIVEIVTADFREARMQRGHGQQTQVDLSTREREKENQR